jgi:hypothetical protein
MGVSTLGELRQVPKLMLAKEFGEKIGGFLFSACRSCDDSRVVESLAPKQISVEDSFKKCTNLGAVEGVVRVLAPDLVHRIWDDASEHQRIPSLLTVKWRLRLPEHRGWGGLVKSSSCQLRGGVFGAGGEGVEERIVGEAMGMLKPALKEPFNRESHPTYNGVDLIWRVSRWIVFREAI